MQAILSIEYLYSCGWSILSVVTGLCNLQLRLNAALLYRMMYVVCTLTLIELYRKVSKRRRNVAICKELCGYLYSDMSAHARVYVYVYICIYYLFIWPTVSIYIISHILYITVA